MSEGMEDPASELAARIGGAIRKERLRQGLKQVELCRHTGRTASHLSRLESGSIVPSLPLLVDLTRGLGVSLEYLICPEDDPDRERLRKPWPERRE